MRKFLFLAALALPGLAAGAALADVVKLDSRMSADQEVPATASDGGGRTKVRFNKTLSRVAVEVKVNGLTSGVTNAHLHCAPAGVNGNVILDLQPITGETSGRIVKSSFGSGDLSGADCIAACGIDVNNIASLRFAADQDCIYVNVHTVNFGTGEVRGQLLGKPGGSGK